MTFEFRILEAEPKDARRLSLVEADAYQIAWSLWEEWYWRTAIEHGYVYKAEVRPKDRTWDGHTVVGGILATPTKQGTVYIDTLVVDSKYQGRGIGTGLLNQIMTVCGGRLELRTKADSANRRVRDFYRSMGFVQTEVVSDYFGQGVSYVLMEYPATKRL